MHNDSGTNKDPMMDTLGLFEHDDDIGQAVEISKAIAQGEESQLAHLVAYTLSGCPDEVKEFYLQEYNCPEKPASDEMVVSMNMLIRHKLDSGLGDELLAKQRSLEAEQDILGSMKLRTVMLAAIMMRHGAKIKDDDMEYLRELVPGIHCTEGAGWPLNDSGFRGPGKRQFLAALDHYQAGNPRSFEEPSCHNCGKVNGDIKAQGKALMKCGGCQNEKAAAWFCDKVCISSPEQCFTALEHISLLQFQGWTSLTCPQLLGLPKESVEAPQAGQLWSSSWSRHCYLQGVRRAWHGNCDLPGCYGLNP